MGGDLNIKKSWHPSNRPNLEKVWKAEEAQTKQLQKLEEWKKEIQTERETEQLRKLRERFGKEAKKQERLEWMYSGAVSSTQAFQEEYLLGREGVTNSNSNNNNIIVLQNPSLKQDTDEPSDSHSFKKRDFDGRNYTIHGKANTDRDLEEKMREDPLYQIKKMKHDQMMNKEKRKKLLDQAINKNHSINRRSEL